MSEALLESDARMHRSLLIELIICRTHAACTAATMIEALQGSRWHPALSERQTNHTTQADCTSCVCPCPCVQWHREIERLIPEHHCNAIRADWESRPQPRNLQVSCNGHAATFFINPETNECCIRNAAGVVMKPTVFERECGKAGSKDWQRSIRVIEPGALQVTHMVGACFAALRPPPDPN